MADLNDENRHAEIWPEKSRRTISRLLSNPRAQSVPYSRLEMLIYFYIGICQKNNYIFLFLDVSNLTRVSRMWFREISEEEFKPCLDRPVAYSANSRHCRRLPTKKIVSDRPDYNDAKLSVSKQNLNIVLSII